jgi:hypothetical protein
VSRRDRLTCALGLTLVLVALTVALVACGDTSDGGRRDMDDDAKVTALEDDVSSARDGVVRAVAAALGSDFVGGKRRHRWCGESYAPRGVRLDEHLRFAPSPLGVQGATDAAARVLEEQGWTVERPGNPAVVVGTRGAVEVRVEAGPAAVQLDLGNPDCLETSDDVARAFADRDSADVAWESPSS